MKLFMQLVSAEVSAAVGAFDDITLSQEELQKLLTLSSAHDMAHIVGAALESYGLLADGSPEAAQFAKQKLLAVFRQEQLNYALTRTAEALSTAEIRFLPLKGAVMREYYPEPWLRTSSDIDILVEPCNLERAITHLGECHGYRLDRRSSHDVSLYTPEGVHVELHYDLIGEGLVAKAHEVLAEVWQDATPVEGQPYHYRSSDAFFYFYHIAHMAKHILQGGCGIRPLLDLWLLSRHCPDAAAREALLERGGLSRFAAVAHNLAEGWFSGGVLDEAAQKMQEYVLQAGVYGTKRNYIKMKQSKRGGRLGYALSKIFLPYDVIKYQYPVLQKRRWLTPFYEVHRWCRLIFCGGARRSLHELSVNAAQSREDMRETAAFIDSIGL